MLDPFYTRKMAQKLSFWRGWAIALGGILFCVLCFLIAQS